MKTKRFFFALSAVALLATAIPAQARDHHHNRYYPQGDRWYRAHHGVVYQNYHHYGYYRPVAPIISIPIPPVIIVRP